MSNFIEE